MMQMIPCPKCHTQVSNLAEKCPVCGLPIDEIKANGLKSVFQWQEEEKEFHGIYRTKFGGAQEPVYCPVCKSENCEWFVETEHIAAETKTKTRYTANLNPLHPFTLVNKKETTKVVRPERTVDHSRILCRNCGHVFS